MKRLNIFLRTYVVRKCCHLILFSEKWANILVGPKVLLREVYKVDRIEAWALGPNVSGFKPQLGHIQDCQVL